MWIAINLSWKADPWFERDGVGFCLTLALALIRIRIPITHATQPTNNNPNSSSTINNATALDQDFI